MNNNSHHQHQPHNSSPDPRTIFHPQNTVAIYTVLSILLRMRKELGIEAMHEFVESYCSHIAKNNPKFKVAVSFALARLNVERMYVDAVKQDKKI